MKKKWNCFILLLAIILIVVPIKAGELRVTNEHPFLVDGSWISAKDLEVGDLMMTVDGKFARITGLTDVHLDEPFKVYNLEASSYHDFVVGDEGVVVHNSNRYGGSKEPICLACDDSANFRLDTEVDPPVDTNILGRDVYTGGKIDKKVIVQKSDSKLARDLNEKFDRFNLLDSDSDKMSARELRAFLDDAANLVREHKKILNAKYGPEYKTVSDANDATFRDWSRRFFDDDNMPLQILDQDKDVVITSLCDITEYTVVDFANDPFLKKQFEFMDGVVQKELRRAIGPTSCDDFETAVLANAVKRSGMVNKPRFKGTDETNYMRFLETYRGKKVQIGKLFEYNAAVCRHRSILLLSMIEDMIEKGSLKGTTRLMWFEGHVAVQFTDKAGRIMVLDPSAQVVIAPNPEGAWAYPLHNVLPEDEGWRFFDISCYFE